MPPAQVPSSWQYAAPVQHDDVIVVPEFFCKEEDWDTYYALIKDPEGVLQLPLLGVKIITMPGDARKPSQAKGERKACCQISRVACLAQVACLSDSEVL